MSVPPPASKRYDRQLRVWGAHGQAALEGARVCVLGAGPTGTEALKNLVLGGIAGFTLVDDGVVTDRDLGNNFLLPASSLGQGRAAAAAELLQELNEAVSGEAVQQDVASLLAKPQFFEPFSLVIATQVRSEQLVALDALCRRLGKPLLAARAYGLFGYLRVSVAEHTVIESKPASSLVGDQLRLHKPWPELLELCDSLDLETLDDVTHSHVPYAILLLKALRAWAKQAGKPLPTSYAEKGELRDLVSSWRRRAGEISVDAENFTEAENAARLAVLPNTIRSEVEEVLGDERTAVTAASSDFWVLAAALRAFVEQEGGGYLPLEGSIPDMTSTTELYLRLQRAYRAQAEAEAAAVHGHVERLLQGCGREASAISRADTRHFVRHARCLRLRRYRSLEEEFGASPSRGAPCREAFRQQLGSEGEAANACAYLLLRAVDAVHAALGRFPGQLDGSLEEDGAQLKGALTALLGEVGGSTPAEADDLVAEFVRFGAAELHCMGAIVGGIAAQEAIKLLTRQFVPLGGTLIYNAIASTTTSLSV